MQHNITIEVPVYGGMSNMLIAVPNVGITGARIEDVEVFFDDQDVVIEKLYRLKPEGAGGWRFVEISLEDGTFITEMRVTSEVFDAPSGAAPLSALIPSDGEQGVAIDYRGMYLRYQGHGGGRCGVIDDRNTLEMVQPSRWATFTAMKDGVTHVLTVADWGAGAHYYFGQVIHQSEVGIFITEVPA